jgi:TolB-like protein
LNGREAWDVAGLRGFISELRRRNVIRAGVLYIGAVWALAQGIAQLGPAFGMPEWGTRWFVIACVIGFPFWIAFGWFYEFTPEGLKRESEVEPHESITHQTGRKLDFAIIAVMAVAIVLLLTDRFVLRHGVNEEAAVPVPEQSIAVLPFVNMSEDKANEYFSDGISEELLNLLAKIPQLQVTARTSSFSFKGKEVAIPEIARTLHVAHVLEGSVRKSGNSLRITAQLIRAGTDTHLWSQTYDRKLDDIFAIQDEIAADVVKQLKVTLLGAAPKARTTDPEAYALYLQARQLGFRLTADALKQADALYRRTLEIDPRYAPAWAGLAENVDQSVSLGLLSGKEGFDRGRESALKALVLDPDYAPAHASSAGLRCTATTTWPVRRGTWSARWHSIRRIWTCCATAPAARCSRPPGRGAGARRGRSAPRPGECVGAFQPGPAPAHGRPARRGDRVVPHRVEPHTGPGRRARGSRQCAAAEGRCAGRAGGDRAGDERCLEVDQPADGVPRAGSQGRLGRGAGRADREIREGRALQHRLRLCLPRRGRQGV